MCIYTHLYEHTQCIKEGNAAIFEITWLSIKYTLLGNPDMERQIQYKFTPMESEKENPSNNKYMELGYKGSC